MNRNSKREPVGLAPRIGDGLTAGAVRIKSRKKMSNMSSMVLRTRPDEEEDQVYPPYAESSRQKDYYVMGSSNRNKNLIDKRNYHQIEPNT